jgi:putative ABC transport system permease protein
MSDLKFAFRQLLNNVVDRYIGTWPFGIQGRVRAHEHDAPQAAINPVGADFFEIVNARVLRGGLFNDADTRGDANVAVINQTLAERFFPGEDPVGQIIERRGDGTSRFYRIIGIVADLKNVSLRNDPFPEIFIPLSQTERFFIGPRFLVRTSADPQAMAAALRKAVLWVNPDQPLHNVRTVEDRIRDLASRSRILRYVMGLFGLLGFTLSMVGLYGVVSYAVNERTREIGVRIAMGAVRRDILLLILRQSLRLVVIGGAMGTLLALASTFVLGNMLYAVSPLDPATYFGVFILVALATVLASLVPARRAARVDPMTALRAE